MCHDCCNHETKPIYKGFTQGFHTLFHQFLFIFKMCLQTLLRELGKLPCVLNVGWGRSLHKAFLQVTFRFFL